MELSLNPLMMTHICTFFSYEAHMAIKSSSSDILIMPVSGLALEFQPSVMLVSV